MNLPIFKDDDQTLMLMQTKWAAILNPLLGNQLTQGNFLQNVSLKSGDNTINHKLGKKLTGYLVTNMTGAFAQLYSKTTSTPDLTFILNSNGTTTVDLYVF